MLAPFRHARRLVPLIAFACISSCAATPEPKSAPPPAEVSFRVRDIKLKSGLRILVEEDHSSPVAGVVALFGAGASADPPGKEGLAHLVEHLTFRARQLPERTMWSLLDEAGAGLWNAATSLDTTTYYEFGPKAALEGLFALEALRMKDPLAGVDEAVFAVEKEVVRNELRSRNEMAYEGAVFGELQHALFPTGHPYARPVVGTHASLDAITLEDARAFVRAHYRPEDATMVVIGDIDTAKVDALLAARLPVALATGSGAVKGSRLPPTAPVVPPPQFRQPAEVASIEGHVSAPELWIAWSLPRSFDASSHLNELARERLEFVRASAGVDDDIIGLTTQIMDGTQASILQCRVMLRRGTHAQRSLEHVLDRLSGAWLPDAERSRQLGETIAAQQKAAATTRLFFEADSMVERARHRALLTHFSGDPSMFMRTARSIGAVTAVQLADFAYEWISRDRARAVLVRPIGTTAMVAGPAGIPDDPATLSAREKITYDVGSMAALAAPSGVSAFHATKLANGMDLIVGRHGSVPAATISLEFATGSATGEPLGVAELVRLVAQAHHAQHGFYEDYGAGRWVDIAPDHYRFSVRVLADNVDQALATLSDEVSSLDVMWTNLRAFREFVLPYLKAVDARPERVAERAFLGALYGRSPFGRIASGDDVEKIDESAADGWIARALNPHNGVLVIGGGIDPEAVERSAQKWFGGWDPSGAPAPLPPAPHDLPTSRQVLVTHVPGATQASIRFSCVLPAPDARRSSEYDLLARLVENRLWTLRTELGATYGVQAAATVYRGGTASLTVRTDVDNGKLPLALARLRKEVDGDPRVFVAGSALDGGKWDLTIRHNVALMQSDALVRAVVRTHELGWPLSTIDEAPTAIRDASAAALVETLAACEKRAVLAIAGDEAAVRPALTASWP